MEIMFDKLRKINTRPKLFEFYTADDLWTDEHTSEQMLRYHLNEAVDLSSRNTQFIDRSVEWIASRFGVGTGIRIVDFGCGPGLYATRLARKQADVTGIDFSKRSIAYAQETAAIEQLDIHYVNQNYLSFETDTRFHLITMIMCDYCALSPAQRTTMLRKFHTLLEEGGAVLLDVYSLNAFEQKTETALYEPNLLDGFFSAGDYYGFLNTFKYEEDKVLLDKYTIVESGRTRTIYNWLQHFNPESLEREFSTCGFVIEELLSDVAGGTYTPKVGEFAVIARKGDKKTA